MPTADDADGEAKRRRERRQTKRDRRPGDAAAAHAGRGDRAVGGGEAGRAAGTRCPSTRRCATSCGRRSASSCSGRAPTTTCSSSRSRTARSARASSTPALVGLEEGRPLESEPPMLVQTGQLTKVVAADLRKRVLEEGERTDYLIYFFFPGRWNETDDTHSKLRPTYLKLAQVLDPLGSNGSLAVGWMDCVFNQIPYPPRPPRARGHDRALPGGRRAQGGAALPPVAAGRVGSSSPSSSTLSTARRPTSRRTSTSPLGKRRRPSGGSARGSSTPTSSTRSSSTRRSCSPRT